MHFLRGLNRRLVVVETAVAGGLVLAVFAVVLSQVLMRYLFSQPNPWTEEVSRFCFIWLSMLGAALAVEHRTHFGFGQAVSWLRPSWRRRLDRYVDWVSMGVSLLLVLAGLALVQLALPQRSPVLNLPVAWAYAAVPTSGLLMLLHLVSWENPAPEGSG